MALGRSIRSTASGRLIKLMLSRLRLLSGLVLALFVLQHLATHALGIIGFGALEQGARLHALIWQHPMGTAALYASLCLHLALGIRALVVKRNFKLPGWEWAQLALGLAIPILLVQHVVGTRLSEWLLDVNVDYARVIHFLWSDPWHFTKQILLVLVVWLHACIGLHYWLRTKAAYRRVQVSLISAASVVGALSIAGFVAAGVDSESLSNLAVAPPVVPQSARANVILIDPIREYALPLSAALLAIVIAVKLIGPRLRPGRTLTLHHPRRSLRLKAGQSVLEAIRAAGIAHASVCGGRARCTTCRIRILPADTSLPQPQELELRALERIGAPAAVRLACQLRPTGDLTIQPLLPSDPSSIDFNRPGGVSGHERSVALLFVDLRGSSALAEDRLPFDVVFVLNLFFAEMSQALANTNGHYAQFAGDGLLALYGLSGGAKEACRDALRGAAQMDERIEAINERLSTELNRPLRIAIGLHYGPAIVGTMGPPAAPIVSAVGDSVNVAARLEAHAKTVNCTLTVSQALLDVAEMGALDLVPRKVPIRGREQPLEIVELNDLAAARRGLDRI